MTARSVIQVEIEDGAWKSFDRSVKLHQIQLKKMPGQWGAVGSAVKQTGNAAAKFVASIVETSRQFNKADGAAKKMTLALKASDRVASSLVRNTKALAINLKDATKSLFSWLSITGLFSGLLGAGGLFGIARLASSVTQTQTSSLQSGTTAGGLKSSQIAYGSILGGEGGVESVLRNIAADIHSGGVMMQRLGIKDYTGKDTATLLPQVLKELQNIYKRSPQGIEKLVTDVFSKDTGIDFNAIMGMSNINLDERKKQAEVMRKQLELSTGTQESWRKLDQQLQLAGERIQNVFIKGLEPLTPSLQKFSQSLTNAIQTIISNPNVKAFIEGAGKSLEKFANYLSSKEFGKDIDDTITSIKRFGEAVKNVAEFFEKWFGENPYTTPSPKSLPKAEIRDYSGVTGMEHRAKQSSNDFGTFFNRAQNKSTLDIFVHGGIGNDPVVSSYAASGSLNVKVNGR